MTETQPGEASSPTEWGPLREGSAAVREQVENGFPGLWVGQSTGSNHPGPGCARGVVFQEVAEHHEVKTSFCLHFSLQTKAATETLCTGHCVPGPLWATCLQAS